MEVKSIKYKNLGFNQYCYQTMFGSEKMDDHIAKMLGDNWEIKSQIQEKDGIKIIYAKK